MTDGKFTSLFDEIDAFGDGPNFEIGSGRFHGRDGRFRDGEPGQTFDHKAHRFREDGTGRFADTPKDVVRRNGGGFFEF